jgi:hypothetical protein
MTRLKHILFALCTLVYAFPLTPAQAVENGSPALGDPNAVAVNSEWSAFLYSPRIVLMMAHSKDLFDSGVFSGVTVGYPGEPKNNGGKSVNGLKIIYAPGFIDRTAFSGGSVFSRKDDFAVIVLEKSIPMTNTVKIATLEQIATWKKNKAEVKMVGYGLQSAEMRKVLDVHGQSRPRIDPNLITTKFIDDAEAQTILSRSLPPGGTYVDDMYFETKPGVASTCDNDSGGGWFVQEGSTRYYLGAASGAWGIPNCGKDGNWNPNGAITSASAAIRFMDVIKQAEDFIKANPEKTVKQAKPAIKTITCIKNKSSKTVKGTNPVCPKGYKDASKIVVKPAEDKTCTEFGQLSGSFTCATFEGERKWISITLENGVDGRPVSGTKCYRDGLSAMGYDNDKNLVTLLCSFKNSPGALPSWSSAN